MLTISGLSTGSPSSLMAVVRNTRSPQTTGLEWPNPATSVRHKMLRPSLTDQWSGRS